MTVTETTYKQCAYSGEGEQCESEGTYYAVLMEVTGEGLTAHVLAVCEEHLPVAEADPQILETGLATPENLVEVSEKIDGFFQFLTELEEEFEKLPPELMAELVTS